MMSFLLLLSELPWPFHAGAIQRLNLELESYVWTGRNQTMTLSAMTTGGPPSGVWRRDGVDIESDGLNITITFELDTSSEGFERLCPYTSRLRAHRPIGGLFSYLVTNRLTSRVLDDTIFIDGKIACA